MLLFAIRSYVPLGRHPLILPLFTSQMPEIDRCAPHRQSEFKQTNLLNEEVRLLIPRNKDKATFFSPEASYAVPPTSHWQILYWGNDIQKRASELTNVLIPFLSAPVVFFCWDKVSCCPDWPQSHSALWCMTTDPPECTQLSAGLMQAWRFTSLRHARQVVLYHLSYNSSPIIVFSYLTTLLKSWRGAVPVSPILEIVGAGGPVQCPLHLKRVLAVSLSYMKSYL